MYSGENEVAEILDFAIFSASDILNSLFCCIYTACVKEDYPIKIIEYICYICGAENVKLPESQTFTYPLFCIFSVSVRLGSKFSKMLFSLCF